MNALIDAATNRLRTTMLIMVMVILAGLTARCSIPIENEPNIEVPFFMVSLYHEGISPEDAERLLVMPMELEIRGLEGVDEVTSYASQGYANLFIEMDVEQSVDQAGIDLREVVDRAKSELPSTAEEPIVRELSTDDFPSIQVNLVGEGVPERMLYNIAIDLRDQIETIPSVLSADLEGAREDLLEAIIDPSALESYAVSTEELINTVLRNNRLIAAGAVQGSEGRFSVKVPSVIETPSDLFDLPIRASADAVVTLGDLASVRRTFKDRSGYARVNGNDTITIDIKKRTNANLIDNNDAIRALVARFEETLPNKVSIFFSQDQAPFAQSQVHELEGNILTALALVMVVVVAAMGLRSGIIVGLGIPVSFLFALIFIAWLDFTFNFMVMFGMLLGLGMLIDGAIVVTEYADRKMMEGFDKRAAYAMAAKRMFWPVTASIATTLAAFLPLMFWPGVPGKFMSFLPITVFTVLAGSLLYALVFGPALGALFGKAGTRDAKSQRTLEQLENGDPTKLNSLTGVYAKVLSIAARYALVTMAITVAALFTSFWAYGEFGKGQVFFSDSDPQFAIATVRARGNLSPDETRDLVLQVEQQAIDIPGILGINAYSFLSGRNLRGATDEVGQVFFEMTEQSARELTGYEILEEFRNRVTKIPGIEVDVQEMEMGPPVGKPIQIEFSSVHKELLEPAMRRVRDFMENEVEGLRDIDDTLSAPGVEWELVVDRAQAALFGADVTQVGVAVQLVTNGAKVGEYRPDDADDAVDIRVRYPEDYRGIEALADLRIGTRQGFVPISNFVTRKAVQRVDTIQRVDGTPVKRLRAAVAPDVLADTKVKEIQAWLDTQEFDPRIEVKFRGANEEQEESAAFVANAFMFSLLLMFVLLVTQFNSFYQAALILFAVVLSTAGVLIGLLITGNPFSSVLTGVGIVALAGIVVNNNIVLIDTYNHLRREHPELDYINLIVRTGAQRLRPVMLTTATTVLGLLPLASNISIDLVARKVTFASSMSMFWEPLSQAIVSGLSFATLLTLVATPAMLALPHQAKNLWGKLKKRVRNDKASTGLAEQT
ncbi:MAG: efflux RND transporter permease subunit [Pseudomonadaceae bacterium]|nr:efflux RND transporter permease subunit [Pseudomonadaceae bacterium]